MRISAAALSVLFVICAAEMANAASVICRGRMYYSSLGKYSGWDDETVLTFDFQRMAVYHKNESTPYRIVKVTDTTIHWLQSFPSGALWEGEFSRVAMRGREYIKGGPLGGNHNVYEQCRLAQPRF